MVDSSRLRIQRNWVQYLLDTWDDEEPESDKEIAEGLLNLLDSLLDGFEPDDTLRKIDRLGRKFASLERQA
jgi:hypothetical protein